ncbi:MAG: glycosyltransferase family 2 protein [Candidatus Aminicenantes bacterium]|nr:glycosyltransferase family 2 protein [Candidatus Aminicenantes bacterium]
MTGSYDRRLTVIIPTWNRVRLLERCLSSLASQRVRCPVLVVDNGSTDSTREMLETRFPEVEALALEENQGFARAVNRGILHCSTDYVALLNNDTEADPGWVEAGLAALERNPSYWFLASRMVDFRRRDLIDSAGDGYDRTGMPFKRGRGDARQLHNYSRPVLGASAGAAFYRRRLFDRIGLFDETYYMYLEDVELSLRAQFTGHPCLYVPEAVVYHIEAASDPSREDLVADLLAPAEEESRHVLPVEKDAGVRPIPPRPDPPPLPVCYSPARVYWITRNRWQLMVTYQPGRNLLQLAYGWGRSTAFHALKAGYLGSFLRGLAAGMARTPQALAKRWLVRRDRVLTGREICRLMNGS